MPRELKGFFGRWNRAELGSTLQVIAKEFSEFLIYPGFLLLQQLVVYPPVSVR